MFWGSFWNLFTNYVCFSSIRQKRSTSKLRRDLKMRVCWKYLPGKWRLGQLLCQLEGVIARLIYHNMWHCQCNPVWSWVCCCLVTKSEGLLLHKNSLKYYLWNLLCGHFTDKETGSQSLNRLSKITGFMLIFVVWFLKRNHYWF